MKLHSLDRKLSMAQSHDGTGSIFLCGPGANLEFVRQILFLHDQRVIARGRHGTGQAVEDGFVIVRDGAGFAVHEVRCAHDLSAESGADGLMSQADAEDRNFSGEVADQIDADAGVLRGAGAGRDHDSLGLHGRDGGDRDLIVAAHFDSSPEFAEILNQVVRERVVVVENEEHGLGPVFSLPLARDGWRDEFSMKKLEICRVLAGMGHATPQLWY